MDPDVVYFTDIPNADRKTGILSLVKPIDATSTRVVAKSVGTVNYETGRIDIGTLNIVSTNNSSGVIEIQAFPESNDVIGLKSLYLNFSMEKSTINMVRDVIASGDEISGTVFSKDYYTSSYSNGNLIRK